MGGGGETRGTNQLKYHLYIAILDETDFLYEKVRKYGSCPI